MSLQVSTSAYQPQVGDAQEDDRVHEAGHSQDSRSTQEEIEVDVDINIPTHSGSTSNDIPPNETCPRQDLDQADVVESAPAPDMMDVDEEVADQQAYEAAPARAREPSPMRASAKRAKDESDGEEQQEGPRRKKGRTAEGGNGPSAPSVRPIAGRRAVRVAGASRAGLSTSGSSGPVDGGVGAARTQKRVQKRVASHTSHLSVSRTGDAAAHLASDAPPADAAPSRSTRAHPAALARSDGGAQAATRVIQHPVSAFLYLFLYLAGLPILRASFLCGRGAIYVHCPRLFDRVWASSPCALSLTLVLFAQRFAGPDRAAASGASYTPGGVPLRLGRAHRGATCLVIFIVVGRSGRVCVDHLDADDLSRLEHERSQHVPAACADPGFQGDPPGGRGAPRRAPVVPARASDTHRAARARDGAARGGTRAV